MALTDPKIQAEIDRLAAGIQAGSIVVTNVSCTTTISGVMEWSLDLLEYGRSIPINPSYPRQTKREPLQDLGVQSELIVGFRDWNLARNEHGEIFITSRNDMSWPHRERLVASCGEQVLADHDSPSESCVDCGIYAWNDAPQAQTDWEIDRRRKDLWGTVYLWGDILIAPKGYRAEYAYPKELFIKDNGTRRVHMIRQELEDAYGVPVTIIRDPHVEVSEWQDPKTWNDPIRDIKKLAEDLGIDIDGGDI